MQEFIQLITGGLSPAYYLAALFFSFLAIFLSMWAGSAKRNRSSARTPVQYSFKFLFWDNTKRILAGLVAMFLLYRFTATLIPQNMTMESAVGIGFFISMGLDQFIGSVKQRFRFFRMDRSRFMNDLKNKKTTNKKSGS